MRLVTLFFSVAVIAGCAVQQSEPEPARLASASPPDAEAVQETRLNAETVAIAPRAPRSPNEVVCVSERVTGSRIPVRRCVTRAQQALENKDARETLQSEEWSTTPGALGGL